MPINCVGQQMGETHTHLHRQQQHQAEPKIENIKFSDSYEKDSIYFWLFKYPHRGECWCRRHCYLYTHYPDVIRLRCCLREFSVTTIYIEYNNDVGAKNRRRRKKQNRWRIMNMMWANKNVHTIDDGMCTRTISICWTISSLLLLLIHSSFSHRICVCFFFSIFGSFIRW